VGLGSGDESEEESKVEICLKAVRKKVELSRSNEDLDAILEEHFNNKPLKKQLKTCDSEAAYLFGCEPSKPTSEFNNVVNRGLTLNAISCKCQSFQHVSCWMRSCKHRKSVEGRSDYL
jgi:hypothetical protein